MYNINLIGQRIVPQRERDVMFSLVSLYALACVLTFLAVAFFSVANFRTVDVYAREIDRLRDDIQRIYPGTPTEGELTSIMDRTKPDLDQIGNLLERRRLHVGDLEGIARSVPDGVWLTRVKLTERPLKTDKGARKGKKKGASGFDRIVLEGLALAEAGEAIHDFARSLENDAGLGGRITEVAFTETGMKRMRGTDVIVFEIACRSRE